MGDALPRLVIAGAGGDAGKTLVSLGLTAAWRREGYAVAAFKKGPDYIDAAWLTHASGRPARNLDVWLMGTTGVQHSFLRHSTGADLSVVEGNRGVFDGYRGHSTAALAKLLGAPVLLVVDATKVTRTAAAFVAGCRALDPELRIAGVVLNRIGGPRHAREITRAIASATGIPVLAAIPRLDGEDLLPDRHLGLVPPEEHARRSRVTDRLAEVMAEYADLSTLSECARAAGPFPSALLPPAAPVGVGGRVKVVVFRDPAFTFYYPENLEALAAAGAEIVTVSALTDPALPEADLLYLGGGFPETHAEALAGNPSMLRSVHEAAKEGLPIYAECGGLVYLSRSVTFRGRQTPLAGVLDVDVVVEDKPQGHGYAEMVVTEENPFFPVSTVLRGHEFHYSRVMAPPQRARSVFAVTRGAGSFGGRDGLVRWHVLATWLHLHATGCPQWAAALVAAAADSRTRRTCLTGG